MIKLIKKISSHTGARYILAGGVSYLAELTVIYLFVWLFNIPKITAVAIAFWIGFAVAFYLQKTFTFSDKSSGRKRILKQTIYYSTLVALNYLFTILFVYILKDIEVGVTRTVALAITTAWNYLIYKHLLFK